MRHSALSRSPAEARQTRSVERSIFRDTTRRSPRLRAARVQEAAELRSSQKAADLKERVRQLTGSTKSCGIFGVKAADLQDIKEAIVALEGENPLQNPTSSLHLLAGKWSVRFSTIKITGSRRIKLGLRDLVQIGQLTQEINTQSSLATNRVAFNVPAFGIRGGELVLEASYSVDSPTRVAISLERSTLVPSRLQSIFEANFDLLLSIFNPEGWLEITYCDQEMRCGRDDKGNIFVLERQ